MCTIFILHQLEAKLFFFSFYFKIRPFHAAEGSNRLALDVLSIGFCDIHRYGMVAKRNLNRDFDVFHGILRKFALPFNRIVIAFNRCLNCQSCKGFRSTILHFNLDSLGVCTCSTTNLTNASNHRIDGLVRALHHVEFAAGQNRTVGIALLTFGNPSQEKDVVDINIHTIGATNDFRNLIRICAGDQSALCSRADGIAPSTFADDIAKNVGVNILVPNPLSWVK